MFKLLRKSTVAGILVCVVQLLWWARGETRLRSVGCSQPAVPSNWVLRTRLLRTLQGVRSPARCLAVCLREPLCVAVNYGGLPVAGGMCELSHGKKTDFPGDALRVPGWTHYEVHSSVVEETAPTTKAATTEAPTTEAPTTEPTTTEGRTTEAPTTEAPTTEAPTTEAPTTEAPTTEAPTTEAPTTEAPTTEAPTTEAPTTEAPTTEAQTTKALTTEAPTTEAPTTEQMTTEEPAVDCWDIYSRSPSSASGEYTIYPQTGSGSLQVYCDMTTEDGGWTVFQRRVDTSQDFYLDWNAYKVGFGAPDGNFWLGNDALNVLTDQRDYHLRVDLESYDSVKTFAKYALFKVENEANKYRLNLTGYYGSFTTGDSLTYHSGNAFTTKDVDNDNDESRQCAQTAQGGWWYKSCSYANLNGPYQATASVLSFGVGITWGSWLGQGESLKFAEMKIRPMSAQTTPKDCWDHFESGTAASGVYTITVTGRSESLDVYCDMEFDGGGWTTLQRREHDDVDFYRGWANYKAGFGTIGDDSDFWLGLDDIHLLTNQDDYQLRVVGVNYNEVLGFARYTEFRVNNEADNYRLTVSGYHGTAGDSLTDVHNGMPWSTLDRDNDNDARHCAQAMQGAWWYNNCQTSNLNGPYVPYPGYPGTNGQGIIWSSWLGQSDSLKKVQMKIRPARVGYA